MPVFRNGLFQSMARKKRLARAAVTSSLDKTSVGKRVVRVPVIKWEGPW